MAEVFLSPERPVTCAEFREWWGTLSPEHQFQFACAFVDLSQAARVLHREYFNDRQYKGEDQHYGGLSQSDWPTVKPKWKAFGLAVENVFGPAVSSWIPAPPLILLNASNAVRRCNIPKTEAAKPIVVEKPPEPKPEPERYVHYEVFVKPDSGPATVGERDSQGRYAWTDRQEAIDVADEKKRLYPHMDFIVHEVLNAHGPRSKVHDTSKPRSV